MGWCFFEQLTASIIIVYTFKIIKMYRVHTYEYLVGGFNPSEKILGKLDHFPK